MSSPTFVIVGAAMAGAKAAEALREEGFDGRIVLLGAETVRPYERPPLSKEYVRGERDDPPFVHGEHYYAEHDIELLLDVTAARLRLDEARVVLADGAEIPYEALLLTTGAAPRRLPVPGADLPGVYLLRSLGDSDELRARLAAGSGRVAIVGAGWIGCEIAASARERGLDVTVFEPQSVPLERVLGPEVGGFYARLHQRHGVDLRCGEGVAEFRGGDRVEAVVSASGDVVECDFALVGIGVRPRDELAAEAGLEVGDGVLVDTALRAAPGVFAAGDVANAENAFYGRRIRVEHWANALEQGPAAARAMLGHDVRWDRLPFFFSDQYDSGMEYRGHTPDGFDDVVFRGDPDSGEFLAFWLKDGVVQAAMNHNIWDAGDALEALIRSRRPVDRRALADADTRIEDLAGGDAAA
jgi:3-phenylpropionate/trans-cinnamate dioxygenase ferredoxin reductase subunit